MISLFRCNFSFSISISRLFCIQFILLVQRPEKPAWALSAAEAEQVEEADVDDLLNFAQSLDFDK